MRRKPGQNDQKAPFWDLSTRGHVGSMKHLARKEAAEPRPPGARLVGMRDFKPLRFRAPAANVNAPR